MKHVISVFTGLGFAMAATLAAAQPAAPGATPADMEVAKPAGNSGPLKTSPAPAPDADRKAGKPAVQTQGVPPTPQSDKEVAVPRGNPGDTTMPPVAPATTGQMPRNPPAPVKGVPPAPESSKEVAKPTPNQK